MEKVMTDYQRKLTEDHLSLVNQVIRRRIRVRGLPMLTYDDLYSVGCEALCRAAMVYDPECGEFAPLASVYIYNAIIDHCRRENKQVSASSDLTLEEDNEQMTLQFFSYCEDLDSAMEQKAVVEAVAESKARYQGVALKGIEALELKSIGFSSREIAERYGTTVNNVNAWISRARQKLLNDPEFLAALA